MGAVALMVCPQAAGAGLPPPAEPVVLAELPLPPLANAACAGLPDGSVAGCLASGADSVRLGGFLPGGSTLLLRMRFAVAPGSGRPGDQLVLVRASGTAFADGSAWKCLTCDLSPSIAAAWGARLDDPQPFGDGRRVLAGMAVFDCAPYLLDDERCTARTLRVYPVETAWAQGPSLRIVDLRLHPDGAHVGFSVASDNAAAAPFAWVASLGLDGPRYVLANPQLLYRRDAAARLVRPGRAAGTIEINHDAIEIEQLRGFSADGREIFYHGLPWESGGTDLFAVDVASGKVRRVTSRPGLLGALAPSPDGRWIAIGDARASGRRRFLAGLRGVPPLTDLVTRPALAALDHADRHFLDLVLLDREGDREGYAGQVLSASSTGWAMAGSPAWSSDGTAIAAVQVAATPGPAAHRRMLRLVLIRLVGRSPATPVRAEPLPDAIGWATPGVPSASPADRYALGAGRHRLKGDAGGEALVVVSRTPDGQAISGVSVVYDKFAPLPGSRLNGEESASVSATGAVALRSNLAQAGPIPARKLTGPEGFVIAGDTATGMMVTSLGAQTWRQPEAGQ